MGRGEDSSSPAQLLYQIFGNGTIAPDEALEIAEQRRVMAAHQRTQCRLIAT